MKRKLQSRKLWMAALGAILFFVANAFDISIPWEALALLVSYVARESAADAMGALKGKDNK